MHQLYDFQYAVQKSKSYVISCHIIEESTLIAHYPHSRIPHLSARFLAFNPNALLPETLSLVETWFGVYDVSHFGWSWESLFGNMKHLSIEIY